MAWSGAAARSHEGDGGHGALPCSLELQRSGAERTREVIFAALADEEAGGAFGAMHWVRERPDLFADADGRPAAAALNEVGGYSMTIGDRRAYAIQVAEKGIIWTRLVPTGTPSHGSMPSPTTPQSRSLGRWPRWRRRHGRRT